MKYKVINEEINDCIYIYTHIYVYLDFDGPSGLDVKAANFLQTTPHTVTDMKPTGCGKTKTIINELQVVTKLVLTLHILLDHLSLFSLKSWWRHQMETFSALLALCVGNSPVPVNSPHKGQWRGAVMFSLICARINGWVNNREAWWFETPSWSLWRQSNVKWRERWNFGQILNSLKTSLYIRIAVPESDVKGKHK